MTDTATSVVIAPVESYFPLDVEKLLLNMRPSHISIYTTAAFFILSVLIFFSSFFLVKYRFFEKNRLLALLLLLWVSLDFVAMPPLPDIQYADEITHMIALIILSFLLWIKLDELNIPETNQENTSKKVHFMKFLVFFVIVASG